jgi:hypothetical protein
MIPNYILLVIFLYNIVNVACQQQKHEQRITSTPDNKLPDQVMPNNPKAAVVVPLSHIANILSFKSHYPFAYIPPTATAFSHNEESIHTAQMSINLNKELSNSATNTPNPLMISNFNNRLISKNNQIKADLVSQILLLASKSISNISPENTLLEINVPVSAKEEIVAAELPTESAATIKNDVALASDAKIQPKEIKPAPPLAPVVKDTSPSPNKANFIPQVISAPSINPTIITQNATAVTSIVTDPIKVIATATATIAAVETTEQHMKACYQRNKRVTFSQYWIPKENEWDETNDGKRVYLGGGEKVKLFDENKKEVGMAPVNMYHKCKMEGTVSCIYLRIFMNKD